MKLVLSLLVAVCVGLPLGATAQEDFDRDAAMELAGKFAGQVKAFKASLQANHPDAPKHLIKDLDYIEMRARRVKSGLKRGIKMKTTRGPVEALANLIARAREEVQQLELSPDTQEKASAAEASALALEAMYGVESHRGITPPTS
jgi:L-alanine-DL-glutamate epimerase-like enolase superfamily enzyme